MFSLILLANQVSTISTFSIIRKDKKGGGMMWKHREIFRTVKMLYGYHTDRYI